MWHTWTIWNALRRRPHHPLYQQNLRSAPFSATPLLIALALVIGSAALLLPTLFSALILLLIGGVYLLGVYQGTVAGLLWSLQIAELSSRARRRWPFRPVCRRASRGNECRLVFGYRLSTPGKCPGKSPRPQRRMLYRRHSARGFLGCSSPPLVY